jgi:exodeoxyribonuclease-5
MQEAGPVELTAEQEQAIDRLLSFTKPVQTLGGYAGTGKTTMIEVLLQHLKNYAVCAYTGKAANVLRRKGVPASTIHSLIYTPQQQQYRDATGRWRDGVEWVLKPPCAIPHRGFIVDEASMVDRNLYEALLSFKRPLIFVGDHGQLPPVNGRDFNLMEKPDITLQQIHRNAGEIARFAEFLRQGGSAGAWSRQPGSTGERVTVVPHGHPPGTRGSFQVICAFNWYRVQLNRHARQQLRYPADHPVVGDRVMCLQNDHRIGVYNGMQGTIADIMPNEGALVFEADGEEYRVNYIPEQFHREKVLEGRDPHGRLPFDYAYAVTCHKAQGDEWDNVLVFEQRCDWWEHARWAYTAASRARERLVWVMA